MGAAGEPQHFVAQLLAILQEEKDEHHDEECRGDELDRRRDVAVTVADVRIGDDADVERLLAGLRRFGGLLHRLPEALE